MISGSEDQPPPGADQIATIVPPASSRRADRDRMAHSADTRSAGPARSGRRRSPMTSRFTVSTTASVNTAQPRSARSTSVRNERSTEGSAIAPDTMAANTHSPVACGGAGRRPSGRPRGPPRRASTISAAAKPQNHPATGQKGLTVNDSPGACANMTANPTPIPAHIRLRVTCR